ncbi:single-stranded DNA-binding protein [Prochlorococcus marinus]|uniref:single-stranded DNA-binding protein n=1 Tax=Prochlorococcus marinus TaxID=1219 RepID=UPI0022B53B3B|nr:single-stranded DNA-binding protein [Prochlorococcus marinus]
MNHCLLEVMVKTAPTIRYTQDSQTPIAEMEVSFEGLRADDPRGSIKAIGWGNQAQTLQNNVKVGEKIILEGRLRMNTVPRQDGTKEKKAEFTVSKIHSDNSSNPSEQNPNLESTTSNSPKGPNSSEKTSTTTQPNEAVTWNASPLIPDTDDIPF